MNIQDSFLNQVRKEGTEVKVALIDGTSLIGTVRGFDNFTVILQSRNMQHLLYKHAIAQVMTRRPGRREHESDEQRHPAGTAAAGSSSATNDKSAAKPADTDAKKADAFNPIDLSGLHADKGS